MIDTSKSPLSRSSYLLCFVIFTLGVSLFITGYRSIEVSYSWEIIKSLEGTSLNWSLDEWYKDSRSTSKFLADLFFLSNYLPISARIFFGFLWFLSLLCFMSSILSLDRSEHNIRPLDLVALFFVIFFPVPNWLGESLFPMEFSQEILVFCLSIYIIRLQQQSKIFISFLILCSTLYFGFELFLVTSVIFLSSLKSNNTGLILKKLVIPGVLLSLFVLLLTIYLNQSTKIIFENSFALSPYWLTKIRGVLLLLISISGLIFTFLNSSKLYISLALRPAITLLIIAATISTISLFTILPTPLEQISRTSSQLGLLLAAVVFAHHFKVTPPPWSLNRVFLLIIHLALFGAVSSLSRIVAACILICIFTITIKKIEGNYSNFQKRFFLVSAILVCCCLFSSATRLKFLPTFKSYSSVSIGPAFDWIRENTNSWSLFLVPPDLWQFQLRSGRSSFVDLPQDGSFDDHTILQQKEKLEQLLKIELPTKSPLSFNEIRKTLGQIYSASPPEQLKEIMVSNGIDYLIVYSSVYKIERLQKIGFKELYQDDWLTILKLSPSSQ